FDFILGKGRNEGWLFSREGLLRYGSAERALASDEENSLLKLEELILAGGFEFPSENELAGEYKRELLTGYLHILRERKSVVRIKEAGYIHSEYISKITGILRDYFADENELDIGKFKKMLGVSRKFAVPILEHLDGIGYTKRVGNRRIAGPELAGAEE
ncbi:MAG TPA: SelB C-terminal domain-containing protein, partial [Candidatus Krumholzibacteriaceae bacterium]|nr:SelB C-terminal domain-containing protein [Candidatus Krumholzibacteriaceae bacterium]